MKCSHCKRILSIEDFDKHQCDLPINDVKRIPVAYFQDDSVNGEKIMTGRGIDGILYSFVVVPRKAIPFIVNHLTTVNMNPKKDDKLPESIRPL